MADQQTRGPQLPLGTTVIDPRGRVGQIVTWLGGDRYEVRYPDDLVAEWMGNSLHLQKHSQRDPLALLPPRDGIALVERGLILKTVTGSRIFGLDTETSDTDVRGVFVCPMEEYLGLRVGVRRSTQCTAPGLSRQPCERVSRLMAQGVFAI